MGNFTKSEQSRVDSLARQLQRQRDSTHRLQVDMIIAGRSREAVKVVDTIHNLLSQAVALAQTITTVDAGGDQS